MKKLNNPLLKIISAACLALILLSAPRPAHAYVDPSVTSYMIQAIAGIVVAVGACFTIYWRRAKKKVQDKLGIDSEAGKEKEEDVQIFDDKDK